MIGWVNRWGVFRPTQNLHTALEFAVEVDADQYGAAIEQIGDLVSEMGESTALPESTAHGVWAHALSGGGTWALHFFGVDIVGVFELRSELLEHGPGGDDDGYRPRDQGGFVKRGRSDAQVMLSGEPVTPLTESASGLWPSRRRGR